MHAGFGPAGVVGLTELYDVIRYQPSEAATQRYTTLSQGMAVSDTVTTDGVFEAGVYASGVFVETTSETASTYVSGRLKLSRIDIRRQLPQTGERFSGFLAQVSARVALEAGDGELDDLLTDYVLRDRELRLLYGDTARTVRGQEGVASADGFAAAFAGLIADARLDSDGSLSLEVADIATRLDRPIQESFYVGAGGAEGGKDIEGQPKPLNYGWVDSATPTLVDKFLLIYQLHDGEVLSIAVRDRGQGLIQGLDVLTYAELEALTVDDGGDVDDAVDIPVGYYATCRKLGYFRLGGNPEGVVTATVEGDGLYDGDIGYTDGTFYQGDIGYRSPGEQTYNRYVGGMLYRILTTRGYVAPDAIDLDRIVQFDIENPYELGLSIPSSERPTVRDVCTRIADSVGAVILRTAKGQFAITALTGPASSSPVTIGQLGNAAGIKVNGAVAKDGVERLPLPWRAPWHRVRVRHSVNWTPLTAEQITADITDEDQVAALKRSASYVTANNPQLAALIPDREGLEVAGLLRYEADAKVIAARILNFYAPYWALWRVTCHGLAFRLDVLDTVRLVYPRHGLDAGGRFLVVAVSERPGRYETEFTLLGPR